MENSNPIEEIHNNPDKAELSLKIKEVQAIENINSDLITGAKQIFEEGNEDDHIIAALKLRRLSCRGKTEHIQEVIDAELMPIMMTIMIETESDLLKSELAWTFTNLLAGNSEQIEAIVEIGIAGAYINMLKLTNKKCVAEQITWGMGNLAGESVEYRDLLLESDAMFAFKEFFDKYKEEFNSSFFNSFCWSVSNLIRMKPSPPISKTSPGIEILIYGFLKNESTTQEQECKIDCLWGFSYYFSEMQSIFSQCVENGVLDMILNEVKQQKAVILHPVLRIVGCYTADDSGSGYDKLLIEKGILEKLKVLIMNEGSSSSIQKESMWIISNLSAGGVELFSKVLKEEELMSYFIEKASTFLPSNPVSTNLFNSSNFCRAFGQKLYGASPMELLT